VLDNGTIVFYTLGAVYLCLMLASLTLFILTFTSSKGRQWPRAIYAVSLAFSMERSYLCYVIPTTINPSLTLHHRWLIVLIDMLPEIAQFSVYLLLLFFIVSLYYSSKKKSVDSSRRRKRIFWGIFAGVVFVPTLAVFIYSMIEINYADPGPSYAGWDFYTQTGIIASLAGLLVIAFFIFGFLLFRQLRKFKPTPQKLAIIKKLQILVVLCVVCYTAHAIMNGIFNTIMRLDPHKDEKAALYLAFAALYFFMTEAFPFACLLTLMFFLFGTQYSVRARSQHISNMTESQINSPVHSRSRNSTGNAQSLEISLEKTSGEEQAEEEV